MLRYVDNCVNHPFKESPSCIWFSEPDLPPTPPKFSAIHSCAKYEVIEEWFSFCSIMAGCPTVHQVPHREDIQNSYPVCVWVETQIKLAGRWPHTMHWDQSFPESQTGQNTVMRLQRYSWVLCLLAPLNLWFEKQMEKQMLAYFGVTYTGM